MLQTVLVALAAIVVGGGPASAKQEIEDAPQHDEASAEEIEAYYDSGRYDRDVRALASSARHALARQLERHRGSERTPAVVLDVDDTTLSNYPCMRRLGEYGSAEQAACAVEEGIEVEITRTGRGLPPIKPVRGFFKYALRREVEVYIITARPREFPFARPATLENLRLRGYRGPFELIMLPGPAPEAQGSLVPYKSGARAEIEREGRDILVNIGDQLSDLKGGHANRKFLLPNPMYEND
jgi:predicted secreted acid phosphatase